jgi:hypothetical protein
VTRRDEGEEKKKNEFESPYYFAYRLLLSLPQPSSFNIPALKRNHRSTWREGIVFTTTRGIQMITRWVSCFQKIKK